MSETDKHDSAAEWSNITRWFETTDDASPLLSIDVVRDALDQKTKPPGALGQLELVAAQLAMLQSSLTPQVDPARVIVFGGDHGITVEGVSAYPALVTAQMMRNFAEGGAAVCVLSAANSIEVEVVDVGVNADLSSLESIVHAKVAMGSRNFSTEPAMTESECQEAMAVWRSCGR